MSDTTTTPPPDCGRRLIPVEIDRIARETPERAWASLPRDDDDLAKGFEDISYAMLAGAIDRLAWFIVDKFGSSSSGGGSGGSGPGFETVMYFGKPDLRYLAVQMACAKTGHRAFFSSHLNRLATHLLLMKKLGCTKLLCSTGVSVDDMVAGSGAVHHVIPELEDLFRPHDGGAKIEAFPYSKTFDEAKFDPYLVVHSSGTTGDPKPIVINHAVMASLDAARLLPDVEGREHLSIINFRLGTRVLMISAPYHAMASAAFVLTVFGGGIYHPGLRHRSAQPKDVYAILDNADIDRATLFPVIMEEIARNPDGEKYMKQLDTASFAGAALSPFASETWSKHTQIRNAYGSSEAMALPLLECPNEDHEYIAFDMKYSGAEFRPVPGSEEGLHELVLTLSPASAEYGAVGTATYFARMGMQYAVDGYQEYATGDLWTPHPDPDKARFTWRFAGRRDDMISFSGGMNLHPAGLEGIIASHPRVKGAIVTGTGHAQAVALVELVDGGEGEEVVVEGGDVNGLIWKEAIEPANEVVQANGYIAETHLVVVPSGEFVRTPKGSVVRRQTIAKFRERVEEVYQVHGDVYRSGEAERVAS